MSKYHAKKTERVLPSGKRIVFDSQKEAERFDQLMLWQKAGGIRKLKLQPEITLQEAFMTTEGERVQAIKYRADFSYEIREAINVVGGESQIVGWVQVIEDAKGMRTPQYLMKRKMALEKGIVIAEV